MPYYIVDAPMTETMYRVRAESAAEAKLLVILEFPEKEYQLDELKSLGLDMWQGK